MKKQWLRRQPKRKNLSSRVFVKIYFNEMIQKKKIYKNELLCNKIFWHQWKETSKYDHIRKKN